MKPWNIIGWAIITAVVLPVAYGLWLRFSKAAHLYWRHLKTRDTPPRKGQRWLQDGSILEIGERRPTGRFLVRTGNAAWGETDADWATRVRSRRLILVRDAESEETSHD